MSIWSQFLEQTELCARVKSAFGNAKLATQITKGTMVSRLDALEKNWMRFQIQHLEMMIKVRDQNNTNGYCTSQSEFSNRVSRKASLSKVLPHWWSWSSFTSNPNHWKQLLAIHAFVFYLLPVSNCRKRLGSFYASVFYFPSVLNLRTRLGSFHASVLFLVLVSKFIGRGWSHTRYRGRNFHTGYVPV